ncbi:MAG: NAD-dependent epimerase/dehydratase family protein [Stygiobacter sp.]
MKKILIIGAAGYVGKFVVEKFQEMHDYEIFALTRNNGKFLLSGHNLSVILKDELSNNNDFDIIVNLAYPTGVTPLKYSEINKEIIQTIKNNIKSNGKIIHTSSLAVFGYPLDFPIEAKPVKKRADLPYVMTKIEMENMLLKNFKDYELHIVRLGNVWGPASPFWTFTLADKLTFKNPVLLTGKDGFSNITDVHNVADYLAFISNQVYKEKITFHHLAEFSDIKWSKILEILSKKLNREIIYLNEELPKQKSIFGELGEVIFSAVKLPSKKFVLSKRFLSGFLWDKLSLLPKSWIFFIKRIIPKSAAVQADKGEIDLNFFALMSCEKQFKSIANSVWRPKFNFEDSMKEVFNWLEEVGY